MTEQTFHISSYDSNPKSTLRFSSLLKYMQEVALADCASYGATYAAMREQSMVFVLIRSSVQLDGLIRSGDVISIKTWSQSIKGASFYRDFIFSRGGKRVGGARTQWVLLNYETRKICKPSTFKWPLVHFEERSGVEISGIMTDGELCGRREDSLVRYSLLDENAHLNNALYLDVLDDAVSIHGDISRADLHYISELHADERFTVAMAENADGYEARMIKENGDVAFAAVVKYFGRERYEEDHRQKEHSSE